MNITLIYTNGKGKQVVKYFNEPMEIIGYIYRCWSAARNAESNRRVRAMIDEQFRQERLQKQGVELQEEQEAQ